MNVMDVVTTLVQVPALRRITRELKQVPQETQDCFSARVEATTQRYPNHAAVIFEGRTLSWSEVNAQANQLAGVFRRMGLRRGDVVSLFMENRIEYITTLIGLNKLGVIASLINSNLTGRPLAHCLKVTGAKVCVFGEERLAAMESLRADGELAEVNTALFVPDAGEAPCPSWASNLTLEAASEGVDNPTDTGDNILKNTALYVFTSGTTGLPKASVLSNGRYLRAATLSSEGGLRCDQNDCIYLCLPMYHGTGLFLGVGAAFLTGASLFIRRKFSASRFLDEVREHGATCFIYIGELCRYLLNVPARPDDFQNPLSTVMGNGLRPDIWEEFKERFGLTRISEFYGSSEGNVSFANLLNKSCTVGTTSYPHALVKYDVDTDEILRDGEGHCIRVEPGDAGLVLGKITSEMQFEGYTNPQETEKKILRGVFEPDDAWFNTGDLMRQVDVGFALGMPHYQFVDRVGDTFRWKSENVSTNEVGEIINAHDQVAFCNVYGVEVPGADGRAGMAAIMLAEHAPELDVASFSAHVVAELPSYARPVFLRIQRELDTTGTFKMVKGELRKQGFDPAQVKDTLYVMRPGATAYDLLDEALAARIAGGEGGY